MRRALFWLISLGAIVGACLTYNANAPPPEYASCVPLDDVLNSPDAIAAGRAIFLQNCTPCHGVRGDGQGEIKPAFGPLPANLADRAHTQSLSPQYLFWRVSEGGRVEPFRSQGSIMPAWKYQLTNEVIAYIRTLAR